MCKTASLAALICTKSANSYHKVWTSVCVNGGTDSMVDVMVDVVSRVPLFQRALAAIVVSLCRNQGG